MGWLADDASLSAWLPEIRRRHSAFERTRASIVSSEGSLRRFVFDNGLDYFGLQRTADGWSFREWPTPPLTPPSPPPAGTRGLVGGATSNN